MPKRKDYTGERYGKLTVISRQGSNKHKKTLWLCKCDCGNEKIIEIEKCRRKKDKTVSCGCIRAKENKGAMAVAHSIYSNYKDGDLTFKDFLYLSQQECWICGKFNQLSRKHRLIPNVFYQYHGLDRLDNDKPHNLNNVKPCCWNCNQMKSNQSLPNFLNWIQDAYMNLFGHLQDPCQADDNRTHPPTNCIIYGSTTLTVTADVVKLSIGDY